MSNTLIVHWCTREGEHVSRFTGAFQIGRDPSCDVQVEDDLVSRVHAEVFQRDGRWWVRDLGSSNGTFLDGARVDQAALPARGELQLHPGGPRVQVELEGASAEADTTIHATTHPGMDETILAETGIELHDLPPLEVTAPVVGGERRTLTFTTTLRIGRDPSCELRLAGDHVSRVHAEIFRAGPHWCVRDLGSTNGTFLDGGRIEHAPLPPSCGLRFGAEGPEITVNYTVPGAEGPAPVRTPAASVDHIARHYFEASSEQPAGEHTQMVRQAFREVRRRHTRRYAYLAAAAVLLLSVAVTVGVFQYRELGQSRELAVDLFYNMKGLELQIANVEELVQRGGHDELMNEIETGRDQLQAMAAQYNAFLDELGMLESDLSEVERIIFRLARVFGECELVMPEAFVDEVEAYIERWKRSNKLVRAVERARREALVPLIYEAMISNHLPPQLFYVALQESEFRPRAIGPKTRFGIAKGMWQLMPATANQYGLDTGPLMELRRYDPQDQRFDPQASTEAAVTYLRDLYNSEAQASGLLVLASYNWGPTKIKQQIREMPGNPRERNFWELLKRHEIPEETRDYVFLVFSAAVIGENPALFGFEFENPLRELDTGLDAAERGSGPATSAEQRLPMPAPISGSIARGQPRSPLVND